MPAVRRWTGREARLLRQALRLSVRAFAEHLGVAARTVSKWEAAGRLTCPRPDTQAILDTALGRADASARQRFELLRSDAADSPPSQTYDLVGGGIGAALSEPRVGDEGDVERRAMLRLVGGAAAGPFVGGLERLRRGVDSALGSTTGGHDADEWERVSDDYAYDVGHVPPAQMLPYLLADLDEIQARVAHSTGDLQTRLMRVTSQLSALTAITLLNVGYAQHANGYWRTALRAADQIGDRSLQALVRGRRAVFGLYQQRAPQSVVKLAGEAVAVAAGTPCAGVASGHAARAQVFATHGHHREAHDALDDLTAVFLLLPDQVREDQDSQWGWSEQRLRHVESFVHSHAGRAGDATAAQDAARGLYPDAAYQGPAQVELHRATCLIVSGDPSEGARHVIRALEALRPDYGHDGLVRRTAALTLDVLPDRARNLPAVTQARDLLALSLGRP